MAVVPAEDRRQGVLDIVCSSGGLSAREVWSRLSEQLKPEPTLDTVRSDLRQLEKQGMVKSEKAGQGFWLLFCVTCTEATGVFTVVTEENYDTCSDADHEIRSFQPRHLVWTCL